MKYKILGLMVLLVLMSGCGKIAREVGGGSDQNDYVSAPVTTNPTNPADPTGNVTPTENPTVPTAPVTEVRYPINITIVGEGSVQRSITMDSYPAGTQVELTAVGSGSSTQGTPLYIFNRWSGDVSSNATSNIVTVTSTMNVTVHFDKYLRWMGLEVTNWYQLYSGDVTKYTDIMISHVAGKYYKEGTWMYIYCPPSDGFACYKDVSPDMCPNPYPWSEYLLHPSYPEGHPGRGNSSVPVLETNRYITFQLTKQDQKLVLVCKYQRP